MAKKAVRNRTVPGEEGGDLFLKKVGQRILKVTNLSLIPEIFQNVRIIHGWFKKGGKETDARNDLLFKALRICHMRIMKQIRIFTI